MSAMHPRQYVPLLLLLLAPVLMLRAQEDPIAEPGSAPLYEVEVIAFRNLDQRGTTAEVETGGAGFKTGSASPPDDGTAAADSVANPAGASAYPPLAPQSLRLDGIAAKLRRGGTYQVLYHGGWVQGIERQNQARPTAVPPRPSTGAGISGSITLYRERFLHALVDIGLLQQARPERRIRQGRRIRGQAVYYFDHPQFGLILAVRPFGGGAAVEPSGNSANP